MYVRWQWWHERRRGSERHYRHPPADAHAILVETVRIDGKPKQRHIAYLGSFHREQDAHYRAWWWHHMNAKLDALGNRIAAEDRPRIEAALAKKVPKEITADEVTAYDLQHQHKMRVEHDLGECRACYLNWPEGQAGVPPRPEFPEVPAELKWANVLAAFGVQPADKP